MTLLFNALHHKKSVLQSIIMWFISFLFIFYFLLAFRRTEKEERGLDLSKFSSDVSKDSSRFMGRLHAPRWPADYVKQTLEQSVSELINCSLLTCQMCFPGLCNRFTTVFAECLGSFQKQIEKSFKFCITKSSVSPQLLIFNGFADSHDIMTWQPRVHDWLLLSG